MGSLDLSHLDTNELVSRLHAWSTWRSIIHYSKCQRERACVTVWFQFAFKMLPNLCSLMLGCFLFVDYRKAFVGQGTEDKSSAFLFGMLWKRVSVIGQKCLWRNPHLVLWSAWEGDINSELVTRGRGLWAWEGNWLLRGQCRWIMKFNVY